MYQLFRFFSFLVLNLVLILESSDLIAIEENAIPPKYELSICAIFKNEAPYLKEWIEYHRMLGANHFYLYDNDSNDCFMEILSPYLSENIVTLRRWPNRIDSKDENNTYIWALSEQIPAYENGIHQAMEETKWLALIDVQDFLLPLTHGKFTDVLEKFSEHPGLVLSSENFEAYDLDAVPRRKLMIEMPFVTQAPKQNIQKGVEKIIFKPHLYKGFLWPPYRYIFKNDAQAISLCKNVMRINRYIHRFKGNLKFRREKEKICVENGILPEKERETLLKSGYEILDSQRAIYRFLPQLLQQMGFES